ncbi:MAG: hypothetical protein ACFFKA_00025 [Candidatus Thorarchaeota archaeon]
MVGSIIQVKINGPEYRIVHYQNGESRFKRGRSILELFVRNQSMKLDPHKRGKQIESVVWEVHDAMSWVKLKQDSVVIWQVSELDDLLPIIINIDIVF